MFCNPFRKIEDIYSIFIIFSIMHHIASNLSTALSCLTSYIAREHASRLVFPSVK